MRIGLTIDSLAPELTGIGRYTWELAQALAQHEAVADLGLFRFDEWVKDASPFLNEAGRRRRRLPRPIRKWLAQRGFRNRLVHGTNYFLPEAAENGIITVHDLSVFVHPETHPPERVRDFERAFVQSLGRARHVITDSEATRRELMAQFGVSADRVTCVYLGVGAQFRPHDAQELLPHSQSIVARLPRDYILSVATFEPRKRIEAAILAHGAMCDRIKSDVPLVLVGAKGWKNDALHDVFEREQRRGRLIMPGYVSDAELPLVYARAKLFLYPSIYEGFGLPPIEAMASGVPVIVANRSCLPEVTRGAAALIDPDDIDRFSVEIERCLFDDQWRRGAIAAGLDVAAHYSWEKCVDHTVGAYRKLAI